MNRDIRCLCRCCRDDYIDAGYTVSLIYPLKSGLCDKCERLAYYAEIAIGPIKKKRKRRRKRKCRQSQSDSAHTQDAKT